MQKLALKLTKAFFLTFLMFSFAFISSSAQPGKKAMKRINTFKKIKLLEILELNEDLSNKFLIAYDKFAKQERIAQEEIKETTSKLEKAIRKDETSKIKDLLKEMETKKKLLLQIFIDKHKEFKAILNEKQFATYIVFNEKFRHELGKRLLKRGKGKGRSNRFD